jgi:DNA helicase HerA-like ATPase
MTPPEAPDPETPGAENPDPVAAARAEAEAAIAAAKLAQEAAEAAVRRAQEAADAAASAEAQAPATRFIPADDATVGSLSPEQVDEVRRGYAFDGPALELGALVNGEALADVPVRIPLAMTNRHGLIAGATGTGKTRTLQVLAEQFSTQGVPVFAADIKGDLSGVATAGAPNDKLLARTAGIGQDWHGAAFPVEYFSLGGRGKGVPIRATVAGFGPLLLSKVLGLNATQESSLGLVFHYAESAGLALLDLADLRAVLSYLISDEGKGELTGLGGLSAATVGVILRELIAFADQGADVFFGEPEIDTADFLRTTPEGTGLISLLEVPGVQSQPALYSTFLMWLLADLFNDLPEVGDLDKPKLVFFFDEAHLLFADASKEFLASIVQTVRLIRSKGVGVFFVTQTPKDLPSDVLAQLGSRVQHQLRAFTPDDAKALRASVRTYPNSGYDLEEVLTVLGTGEAIVTVMNEKGAPSPVAWTRLRAPQGSMTPTPEAGIDAAVAASPLLPTYGAALDRDSARELLASKLQATHAAAEAARVEAERAEAAEELQRQQEDFAAQQAKEERRRREEYERAAKRSSGSGRTSRPRAQKSPIEEILRSPATKTILTGVLTGIFGTRRRR